MDKKNWYVYTHTHKMEYFSAIKEEILPIVPTWIDLEGIMLSKKSQTEKYEYCMISYKWNLKNTNPSILNRYREQTGGCLTEAGG